MGEIITIKPYDIPIIERSKRDFFYEVWGPRCFFISYFLENIFNHEGERPLYKFDVSAAYYGTSFNLDKIDYFKHLDKYKINFKIFENSSNQTLMILGNEIEFQIIDEETKGIVSYRLGGFSNMTGVLEEIDKLYNEKMKLDSWFL